MIAKDFTSFTEKVVQTLQTFLNDTKSGEDLLNTFKSEWVHAYLARNNMSNENSLLIFDEWDNAKQNLMVFLFFKMMEFDPLVTAEFVAHLYDEFQKLEEN